MSSLILKEIHFPIVFLKNVKEVDFFGGNLGDPSVNSFTYGAAFFISGPHLLDDLS